MIIFIFVCVAQSLFFGFNQFNKRCVKFLSGAYPVCCVKRIIFYKGDVGVALCENIIL